jgi:hypothetical protein
MSVVSNFALAEKVCQNNINGHQFRHQKVLGFISKLGLAQPIPSFILHKPNFNNGVQYVVLVHYCARTSLLAPLIISSLHGSRQAPPGQRAFAWSGSATALKSTRGAGIFCNRHSLCFPGSVVVTRKD